MKTISTLLLLTVLSTVAHAQSYLVRANGVVLNVDNQGNLYDRGQFLLPYMIRYRGGQFYVTENRQITTVDENGFFYRIDPEIEAPKKIRFSGFNYFIENDGTTWTIDRQGVLLKGEGDKAFKKPLVVGGTFFTVEGERGQSPRLFVVTDRGNIVETTVPGLRIADIKEGGNNWLITRRGVLYTISRDGFIYSKEGFVDQVSRMTIKGGNFFVMGGIIYTISEDGLVHNQGDASVAGEITKTGHNYFLTRDAKFFAIDSQGNVAEKTGKFDLKNVALTTF